MRTKRNHIYRDIKRNVDSINFDSISELMEHTIENKNNLERMKKLYKRKSKNIVRNGRAGHWLGLKTDGTEKNFDDVAHDVMYGDEVLLKELRKRIQEMDVESNEVRERALTIKKRKRKKTWGYIGDEVDIHRVNAGRLDSCWRTHKLIEQDRVHHHVVIFVDLGAPAFTPCEQTLWRAAVALQACDSVIAAGKNVKIIAGGSSKYLLTNFGSRTVTTTVTIKDYNESLSMEKLAVMTNAKFLRTIQFGVMASHPETINSSFGTPTDWCRNNAPLNIQEEGTHVKYIYLPQSNTIHDARQAMADFGKQWSNENE